MKDARGKSNDLVLMPDYADDSFIQNSVPASYRAAGKPPEDVLVDAINAGDPSTQAGLGNPAGGARYLITDRLPQSVRQSLGSDHPLERLQRYVILRYPTIQAAEAAETRLARTAGIAYAKVDQALEFSFAPDDDYFAVQFDPAHYQWGLHAMNFPAAWDKTKGHGYIGVSDSLKYAEDATTFQQSVHPDLRNVSKQVSPKKTYPYDASKFPTIEFHGRHVAGIIAGTHNNGIGVSGGCPGCSLSLGHTLNMDSTAAGSINDLVKSGVQVINMSYGDTLAPFNPCDFYEPLCLALDAAKRRDILLVAAAGNYNETAPQFPASYEGVLSVGGAQFSASQPWTAWFGGYNMNPSPLVDHSILHGTNYAGLSGVMAPAAKIVSTTNVGEDYIQYAPYQCSDAPPPFSPSQGIGDESGIYGDGYGSCTGTSMAAPFVTALGGLLRSIDPRATADQVKSFIRSSGDRPVNTAQYGYGMPDAALAVNLALAQATGLTPLFSFYSSGREDYFYTTVPQAGKPALDGLLPPVGGYYGFSGYYGYTPVGQTINGYANFPDSSTATPPRAQVWLFTTRANPVDSSKPLLPLARLSWACGDKNVTNDACERNNNHTDFVYTADPNSVPAFQLAGYYLDGIEGYIFPKTMASVPPGAVKLMRKYNPTRDDHAIFPESELAYMTAQGYTLNSGSDWLGYAYPNLTGNVPNH